MNAGLHPQPVQYTLTAQLLHWLIALLIFGLFPLGLYMHDLPLSMLKIELCGGCSHPCTGASRAFASMTTTLTL